MMSALHKIYHRSSGNRSNEAVEWQIVGAVRRKGRPAAQRAWAHAGETSRENCRTTNHAYSVLVSTRSNPDRCGLFCGNSNVG